MTSGLCTLLFPVILNHQGLTVSGYIAGLSGIIPKTSPMPVTRLLISARRNFCWRQPYLVADDRSYFINDLLRVVLEVLKPSFHFCPVAERVSPIRYSKRIFSWASCQVHSSRSFLRIDFAYRCVMFYNIIKLLSRPLIYKWTSRKPGHNLWPVPVFPLCAERS